MVINPFQIFSYIKTKTRWPECFCYNGHWLPYFDHPYTFNTERRIEIPIALHHMNTLSNVMEVGNVLSRFISTNYPIVDKYEKVGRIINKDIVGLKWAVSLDQIVCISTLEHVGWDHPEEKDNLKTKQALESMHSLLKPGGRLLLTFPIGYNIMLDDLFYRQPELFGDVTCMKRRPGNKWGQTTQANIRGCAYGRPFKCANGLVVSNYEK